MRRVHHTIDYLGTALLSLAATSLILLTSLGGTTYPWASAPIYLLGVAGAALIGAFVLAERRAVEPILPLHLFSTRVFSVTSVVGFVVGFGMFGAITYLPAFLQVVRGISPTISGLYLLPLMAGHAGGLDRLRPGHRADRQVPLLPDRRHGADHRRPVPAVADEPRPSTLTDSLSMLVLGMGLGGVMQVLVIIVQNGVPHSELGVATSGATFFRSIGGSFGTAIFGAIFANVLVGNLASHLHGVGLPAGFSPANVTPAALGHLPAVVHAGFVAGDAESIQTVFLIAVPIGLLAFLGAWLIPQVELKQWAPAASAAPTAEAQAGEPRDTIPAADNTDNTVPQESLDPQDACLRDD